MAGIYKPMPRNQRVGSWGYKPPQPKKPKQFGSIDSSGVWSGTASNPWNLGGPGFTVQDSIQSGQLPFSTSLGGLGYTPRTRGLPGDAGRTDVVDWGGMIGGDWEVQDAEAAMGAGMARRRGDFQAGLRSALIDLGIGDTSKLGSLGKYIDNDTISKAVQNKYSAVAQSQQQATRARATNNSALAARGLLSSGQTTKSQEDVLAAQESANYMGLRDFLAGGASGLTGLADAEEGFARGIAQARAAAAARAAEMAYWGAGQNDLSQPDYGDIYDRVVPTSTYGDIKSRFGGGTSGSLRGVSKPVKPRAAPKKPIYMGGAYRY